MNRREFFASFGAAIGGAALVKGETHDDIMFLPPYNEVDSADLKFEHGKFLDDWAISVLYKKIKYIGNGNRWPTRDFARELLSWVYFGNQDYLLETPALFLTPDSMELMHGWWFEDENDIRYLCEGGLGRAEPELQAYSCIKSIGYIPDCVTVQLTRDGKRIEPWWGPGHISVLLPEGGSITASVDYYWEHSEYTVRNVEGIYTYVFPLTIRPNSVYPGRRER